MSRPLDKKLALGIALLLSGCTTVAPTTRLAVDTDSLMWLLGILLPLFLIASAAKVVVVRAESRKGMRKKLLTD